MGLMGLFILGFAAYYGYLAWEIYDARRVDPAKLGDGVDVDAADPLHRVVSDVTIPVGERFALAVASPAFQWR